ncbi:MAG: tetratricopeptide repeat protein [Treponema sp.]|nr:tetratricopeptide repeat protein [Treponema sp.]
MKNKIKAIFIAFVTFCIFTQALPVFAQAKQDALKLYREKKYTEAIAVCEAELAENPSNIDSYAVLCWSLVKNKQYAEAEQRGLAANRIKPYDGRILEIIGEAKFYQGKNIGAMQFFQDYIANATKGTSTGIAYYFMGEIYIKQAKYQHADISLSMAVREEPLLDYWWMRLGYAREKTSSYESALKAYNKALELNPSQADALRGKARCTAELQ